jgi:hypothetical protein
VPKQGKIGVEVRDAESLSRLDFDFVVIRPQVKNLAREFTSVVTEQGSRQAPALAYLQSNPSTLRFRIS